MKKSLLLTALFLFLLAQVSWLALAQVPSFPARVGGTVKVDGTQLTQATDTGYTFTVTKQDGTAYDPVAGDTDGLSGSDMYIIDIPIYEATAQPGGAQPGETAVIHGFLDGNELTITSPTNGEITVGTSGSTAQVDIEAQLPDLPEANAGSDQVVFTGNTITLDGSQSTDPDGNALTYSWSFISRPTGSNSALSDSTEANATFIADIDGTYVLQLVASNNKFNSKPDNVIITAAAATRLLISTNGESYRSGDTLKLYLNVIHPDPVFPKIVDAFIGIGLPDGSLYFFDSSLNLSPSSISDARTFTPFATNVTLPTSYTFPSPSEADGDPNGDGINDSYVFFTIVLPQMPAGNYLAFGALAEPGSVQAGSPKLIGNASLSYFSYSP
jgi:hypothetical protein